MSYPWTRCEGRGQVGGRVWAARVGGGRAPSSDHSCSLSGSEEARLLVPQFTPLIPLFSCRQD